MFSQSMERIIAKWGWRWGDEPQRLSNGQRAKRSEITRVALRIDASSRIAATISCPCGYFPPSATSQNNPWEKGTGTRKLVTVLHIIQ